MATVTRKNSEHLLNLIYDAAADERLWCSVLTKVADLTRSQGGILFGQSMAARRVYFDYNGRLSEECNQVYQDRHLQNLWSHSMQTKPVGRVVFSDDVVELSTLRKTEFFDEVLRPQGVAHNGMVALAAHDDFRAAFNICRNIRQGPFGTEERRLLNWIVPHLRRSIVLGFKIGSYQAMQHAALSALDRLSDGVILLDRQARILFANAAARALDMKKVLRIREHVTAPTQLHSQRLARLVRASLDGSAGGIITLPGNTPDQFVSVLVTSLRSREVGYLSDQNVKDAAVVIFIVDLANRQSIPLERLVAAYGLTHAEARVALTLSSGKTVPEAARHLAISPNTIKTQLHRIFSKTATHRQTELVKLITSLETIDLSGATDPQS